MVEGHGDDMYLYQDIQYNFSSNVFVGADLSMLRDDLCRHIDLIHHYPEPEAESLREQIADRYAVSHDNILVTNGATDAIYLVAQVLSRRCPYYSLGSLPTFSEYEDACRMVGMSPHENGLPAPASNTVLWICNPNNPTGDVYSHRQLMEYSERYAFVVIDQSYQSYTVEQMMTQREAAQSRNIIQIHSLTKTYAIPGLRIGYIVAPAEILRLIRPFVRPWSVNALAIEAGKWLLSHDTQAVPHLENYLAETRRLHQQLNTIPGIQASDTHTHFILSTIHPATAAALKEFLASRHHILIRDASNFNGLTPHHFRIATQSPQANDILVNTIRQFQEMALQME